MGLEGVCWGRRFRSSEKLTSGHLHSHMLFVVLNFKREVMAKVLAMSLWQKQSAAARGGMVGFWVCGGGVGDPGVGARASRGMQRAAVTASCVWGVGRF